MHAVDLVEGLPIAVRLLLRMARLGGQTSAFVLAFFCLKSRVRFPWAETKTSS